MIGSAKIFDGDKLVSSSELPEKVKRTKDEFKALWAKCKTEAQRVRLIETTEPVQD